MMLAERRDGFALPMTIFIIAVITVMLTAVMLRVTADRRIADASGSMAQARMIAQSGLQSYLGTRTIRPEYDTANWTATKDGDSMRVNVTGGYATVVARIVQKSKDTSANETYIVTSTGYYVIPTLGSDPQARRTVAQFAVWQSASLDSLTGAITLIDGQSAPGGAIGGRVSGVDSCGLMPTKVGVTLSNGKSVTGTTLNQTIGNSAAVYTATGIVWSADTTKISLSPDYPVNTVNYDNNYSVYLVQGSLTIPKNSIGTGLLIVTGNMNFSNGNSNVTGFRGWKGVVLVGGQINFPNSDSVAFLGQVIAGLNKSNKTTDLTYQHLDIKYSSCEVKKALASFAGMHPIANAWTDNWAAW